MPGPIIGGHRPQGVQPTQQNQPVGGQNPVGLGGRQLGVAQPGAPRNPVLKALSDIGHAIARVFTPAQPGPGRAQAAEQRAVAKLDGRLGELLGGLSRKQSGEVGVNLYRLERAQAQLAGAGGDGERALGERLGERLGQMSTQELRTLAKALRGDNVAQAQVNLGGHPEAEQLLMRIETAVVRELGDRARTEMTRGTDRVVDQALEALDKGESDGRIAGLMQAAFHPATNELGSLRSSGVSGLDDKEVDREVARTVQDSLSRLPQDKLDRLLQKTPTDELRRLALAGPEGAVAGALDKEIAARTERLTARYEEGCAKFLSHDPAKAVEDPSGPLHDPVNFARSLTDLAEALQLLRDHCKTHNLPLPPRTDELLAKIMGHGEELLRPGNLNLGELSNERLGIFAKSLKLLGIERANGPIQKEIETRLAPQETAYRQSARAMLDGLRSGDPARVLAGLRDMEANFSSLKNLRNDLVRDMVGAPEVARLREKLTGEALAGLSDQELMEVFAALQKPENKALLEGLYVAGEISDRAGQDNYGVQLNVMGAYLEETLGQVATELEKRGVSLPRDDSGRLLLPSSGERPSLGNLTPAARQVFRDLLSVELGEGRDTGRLNRGTVRGELRNTMEGILKQPTTEIVALPGGAVVSEQFYKDAMRCFEFRLPGGESLIDYGDWETLGETERKARIESGFQRLVEFCEGDGDMALLLTRHAHQGLAAGFFGACVQNPDDNPVRLPDGRSGIVDQGWPGHFQYVPMVSFVRDGNGRPQIDFSLVVQGGMLQTMDGGMVWLDPETSRMSYRYRAALGEDGTLSFAGAPSYDLSLNPSRFQKPYAPPTLDDVRDPKKTALRGDVLDFARGIQSGQLVQAQYAMDEFRAQPTLLRALKVVDQHLRPGAPGEVGGLPGTDGIRDTVDQAAALARQALVAAFDDTLTHIDGLIQDNYYNGREHTLSSLPGWPAGFQPPPTYRDLLQSGNQQAIEALHNHIAHPTRAPEMIAFKRALQEFALAPGFEGAEALFERFIKPAPQGGLFDVDATPSDTLNLDNSTRDTIRERLDEIRDTPLAPTLFDDPNRVLCQRVEQDILPAMTAAVNEGRF
ncbi:hypothetical protein [Pseudothauera rhizosphaerae]|uniref:Uncharacterized protein n=1 Tax=Pseudothauera rhizosphaerae TaxID=2565932 RepID=A0A4S4ADX5_9RHOO|nr:hypothetical protein [Pseudothauera rhizosphaerae]THF57285.1 hypothetical protein E6O51_18485 [Pseudothauera rhizosphaerae]